MSLVTGGKLRRGYSVPEISHWQRIHPVNNFIVNIV